MYFQCYLFASRKRTKCRNDAYNILMFAVTQFVTSFTSRPLTPFLFPLSSLLVPQKKANFFSTVEVASDFLRKRRRVTSHAHSDVCFNLPRTQACAVLIRARNILWERGRERKRKKASKMEGGERKEEGIEMKRRRRRTGKDELRIGWRREEERASI